MCVQQASQGHCGIVKVNPSWTLMLLILFSLYSLSSTAILLPRLAFIFLTLLFPGGKQIPAER